MANTEDITKWGTKAYASRKTRINEMLNYLDGHSQDYDAQSRHMIMEFYAQQPENQHLVRPDGSIADDNLYRLAGENYENTLNAYFPEGNVSLVEAQILAEEGDPQAIRNVKRMDSFQTKKYRNRLQLLRMSRGVDEYKFSPHIQNERARASVAMQKDIIKKIASARKIQKAVKDWKARKNL